MSFLNGAELILNFPRATAEFKRKLAHAERMQAKRNRSPSRQLVARALSAWRTERGYDAESPVYPEGWAFEDFTAQVNWAKAQA